MNEEAGRCARARSEGPAFGSTTKQKFNPRTRPSEPSSEPSS